MALRLLCGQPAVVQPHHVGVAVGIERHRVPATIAVGTGRLKRPPRREGPATVALVPPAGGGVPDIVVAFGSKATGTEIKLSRSTLGTRICE